MTTLNRRGFLAAAPAIALAPSFASAHNPSAVTAKLLQRMRGSIADSFPSQDPEVVSGVVGASHTNLDRVKELVTKRPQLAKAAWDWGFGDWETALGACSHTGRRDIAEFLIAHGARPDIFTFAMLGQVDVVRAFCTANPGIQRNVGPHGTFTLMRHARVGRDDAKLVVEYLEELGDADIAQPKIDMTEANASPYMGTYSPNDAPGVKFIVAYNERQTSPTFAVEDGTPRALFSRGNHIFNPGGAPNVVFTFSIDSDKPMLHIQDGELELTAERVPA
ncbi:MAG: hypothetical protein H6815_06100 [Phycisphaeraceae bacterium]|nr:hypothetical protein [Phycisphaerales bacterium]MCB9860010.1 hypothetical protein [Phycisphaeraceae bacterium]